ncbi:MAG: polysaccharide deacetylase family protein [Planctomycetes bacterium]|nr:polysaccharide deacetylase family protein [Planctomycetota bacterium]
MAARLGVLRWLRHRAAGGATVLMYHRVLPEADVGRYFQGLALTPRVFEDQVRWLVRHFTVMPVREAWSCLNRGGALPSKPIVSISFDDGYRDNFDVAAATLERHGLRGTFFVTTDFVLEGRMFWFDVAAAAWRKNPDAFARVLSDVLGKVVHAGEIGTLDEMVGRLKRLEGGVRAGVIDRLERELGPFQPGELDRPMDAEMLRTLHRRGHEIGSHTLTHPMLPQLDDARLRAECADSKARLEECLGAPVVGLCYPNGSVDSRVRNAAKAAGYEYACTTRPGLNRSDVDALLLHRNHASAESVTDARGGHHGPSFAAVVVGFHALAHACARGLKRRGRASVLSR